jgi:archaellum component FlaG (FlaF/FlaG flagellin family)
MNGTVVPDSALLFISPGNSGELEPGQVGDLYVSIPVGAGYNQLTLILESGVQGTFTFQTGVS